MQKLTVVNDIMVDGEEKPIATLPQDQAEQLCQALLDCFMEAVGYRREIGG